MHDLLQHLNRILHHAQDERPAGHAESDVEFQHLPAVFVPDRRHLNRPVKIGFLEPGQQRMQQSVRDAVFILRIPFYQSAERGARHDAEVAVKGAFVFLICYKGINLAIADKGDMPDFVAPHVFLQEHAFFVIDIVQPVARLFEGFADNGMHRAGRRAERVFNDIRRGMLAQNFFGFEFIAGDIRFGKRHVEPLADFLRIIALAFNHVGFAGRAENRDVQALKFLRPLLQRPVNGHRNDKINLLLLQQFAGIRIIQFIKGFPFLHRPVMAVIAVEIGRNVRARFFQNPQHALRKRADAEQHDITWFCAHILSFPKAVSGISNV